MKLTNLLEVRGGQAFEPVQVRCSDDAVVASMTEPCTQLRRMLFELHPRE